MRNLNQRTAAYLLSTMMIAFVLWAAFDARTPVVEEAASLPNAQIAARIAERVAITAGEHVLLGHDPGYMKGLVAATKAALEGEGATVELHAYGESVNFAKRLVRADVYIFMPYGPETSVASLAGIIQAAGKWVMEGNHRQVHFHWGDGTRSPDGTRGVHSLEFDRIYTAALEIDYQALDQKMRRAEAMLREGPVHVTTPEGTDIRFRIGRRPVTIQSGDASLKAISGAVVSIQREIELPAGVLRVAPLEESVEGVVVVPFANLPADLWAGGSKDPPVINLRLVFKAGLLVDLSADKGADLFRKYLGANSALDKFREFGLGFNPKLVSPDGSEWLAYYGYGAGVVRLSLGNNIELGGAVSGDGVRWLLFADATVRTADGSLLVEDGVLQDF